MEGIVYPITLTDDISCLPSPSLHPTIYTEIHQPWEHWERQIMFLKFYKYCGAIKKEKVLKMSKGEGENSTGNPFLGEERFWSVTKLLVTFTNSSLSSTIWKCHFCSIQIFTGQNRKQEKDITNRQEKEWYIWLSHNLCAPYIRINTDREFVTDLTDISV